MNMYLRDLDIEVNCSFPVENMPHVCFFKLPHNLANSYTYLYVLI